MCFYVWLPETYALFMCLRCTFKNISQIYTACANAEIYLTRHTDVATQSCQWPGTRRLFVAPLAPVPPMPLTCDGVVPAAGAVAAGLHRAAVGALGQQQGRVAVQEASRPAAARHQAPARGERPVHLAETGRTSSASGVRADAGALR